MKDFLLRPQNTNIKFSDISVIFTFSGRCRCGECKNALRAECPAMLYCDRCTSPFTSLIAIAGRRTFAIQHINCIFEYLILLFFFRTVRASMWPCGRCSHARENLFGSIPWPLLFYRFSMFFLVRTQFLLVYRCFANVHCNYNLHLHMRLQH